MQTSTQCVQSCATVPADDAAKIKAAADQFEGYFIGQLLREMRRSAQQIAAGSDEASPMQQDLVDLADVAVGNSLASQHAFGIADAILRQLLPTPVNETGAAVALNRK